jgi:hypothetical protein
MRLRRAVLADVPALLAIKAQLVFEVQSGRTAKGGFLLGTDAAGYAQRIEAGEAWVMDADGVQGFALVLPDAPFRRSEVWQRRDQVQWGALEPADFAHQRLCYFDQLAVRRGSFRNRRWGAVLAYHTVRMALQRHDCLITATVAEPVLNLAAVPYLNRAGAEWVGRLDEVVEPIGPLVSDIWLLTAQTFQRRVAQPQGRAERWVVEASAAVTTGAAG